MDSSDESKKFYRDMHILSQRFEENALTFINKYSVIGVTMMLIGNVVKTKYSNALLFFGCSVAVIPTISRFFEIRKYYEKIQTMKKY